MHPKAKLDAFDLPSAVALSAAPSPACPEVYSLVVASSAWVPVSTCGSISALDEVAATADEVGLVSSAMNGSRIACGGSGMECCEDMSWYA